MNDNTALVYELDIRAVSGGNVSLVEVLEKDVPEAATAVYGIPKAGFRAIYGAAPENVVIVETVGDSMAPELPAGVKVYVDISDKRPTPPGIFVVWDGLGLVLKRVHHIPHSDPPMVRIVSVNPAYPPYDRLLDEAHIQGRVVGRHARM